MHAESREPAVGGVETIEEDEGLEPFAEIVGAEQPGDRAMALSAMISLVAGLSGCSSRSSGEPFTRFMRCFEAIHPLVRRHDG